MRWTQKSIPDKKTVESLAQALGVKLPIATLLVQRGITTFEQAKSFFRPNISELHDPYLMKDMDKAVTRLEYALNNNERILVYGDYDVDGTTSVAMMSTYLESRSNNIATYIPDRFEEGYGVSYKGIAYALDNNISLIIALDCGVKAIEKVEHAKENGIDFIICDHHRPGDKLPPAVAVLDPKRSDCDYPFKELCGCGVGFKLIQALNQKKGNSIETILPYLDLVATAIGADIVPIIDENRILTYYGLQRINTSARPGFKALIQNVQKKTLTISDVVFTIAPRINAAGRMKHGNYAVSLLKESDIDAAQQVANDIEFFNTTRRSLDQEITQQALLQLQDLNETQRATTVVFDPSWNKGVIGIVASRLIETYYRPTIVFTQSGDYLTASARSVRGFDVHKALQKCEHFIEQFGGHKYAAGLTIKKSNYQAFKQAFEETVQNSLSEELKTPEINIDFPINLSDITPKFVRILKQFAPFGPYNMAPLFSAKKVIDTGGGKCVGQDQKHLKIRVQQHNSAPIDCIGFGLGHKLELIRKTPSFSMVFSVEENEWQGQINLQLNLKDIKPE